MPADGAFAPLPSPGPSEPSPRDASEAPRGLGADAGQAGVATGPSGNVILMYVTGTASAGILVYDQAWFFSQLADTPVDTTYSIATVTPAVARFSNAQVADFITFEPLFCINANIVAASAAAVISGMTITPVRFDPFGNQALAAQYQAAYQTASDFQTTRGQFPLGEVIDGYTYLRALSPIQVAAATYTVAFMFGPRQDRRVNVPRVQPVAVRSVNK
jgi:hypothetical protein